MLHKSRLRVNHSINWLASFAVGAGGIGLVNRVEMTGVSFTAVDPRVSVGTRS